MRRIFQMIGAGAVLAGTLALATPAAADWDSQYMHTDSGFLEWYIEWRDHDGGSDVRFDCYNMSSNRDVRCYMEEKIYNCGDGSTDRRGRQDIGRANAGEREGGQPDYGVCRGHGGIAGYNVRTNFELLN